MEAEEVELESDEFWKPEDVVAIEYDEEHRPVPSQYQRYAR
jgi:hypothetical protein